MQLIGISYFVIINILCFALMGVDKYKAKHNQWRISEKTLFTVAFIGGAIGGMIGMQYFRHKTKHATFVYGFPIFVILQISFVAYIVLH